MSKITKSARGEECQIRIPGHCNGNSETVVFCHISGAGMGRKSSDIHGAYGCGSCHDIVDGRKKSVHKNDIITLWFYDGVLRTQLKLIEKGLINVV
ncbi:DUF1364 domain-containing protein [Candidatus Pacearchaeota archaeon]|nr:DUF1364 domain-containing protein [Candidatus Pacearchaeota archaeon]